MFGEDDGIRYMPAADEESDGAVGNNLHVAGSVPSEVPPQSFAERPSWISPEEPAITVEQGQEIAIARTESLYRHYTDFTATESNERPAGNYIFLVHGVLNDQAPADLVHEINITCSVSKFFQEP